VTEQETEFPQRIVVVSENGMGRANARPIPPAPGAAAGPDGADPDGSDESEAADGTDAERNPTELIEEPAKVMRIGSMIKQLLDEVKAAPLDDASRRRLAEIHASSVRELKTGLAPELADELDRLSFPFATDAPPSDAELRIAHAQLVGWLEGLFHGIQTALFAQQMAARAQLEQMRRALPVGQGQPQSSGQLGPGQPGVTVAAPHPEGGGMYL